MRSQISKCTAIKPLEDFENHLPLLILFKYTMNIVQIKQESKAFYLFDF